MPFATLPRLNAPARSEITLTTPAALTTQPQSHDTTDAYHRPRNQPSATWRVTTTGTSSANPRRTRKRQISRRVTTSGRPHTIELWTLHDRPPFLPADARERQLPQQLLTLTPKLPKRRTHFIRHDPQCNQPLNNSADAPHIVRPETIADARTPSVVPRTSSNALSINSDRGLLPPAPPHPAPFQK